jgi:hypothetical protein
MPDSKSGIARSVVCTVLVLVCCACAGPVDDGDSKNDVGEQADQSVNNRTDNDTATAGDAAGACGSNDDCGGASGPCEAVRCIAGECVELNIDGLLCDDGVPCTVADVCKAGKCAAGADLCACRKDEDCPGGDKCEGTAYCDTAAVPYTCKVNAATVVTCDVAKDTPCEAAACDPATGKCALKPRNEGLACSDGQKCTVGEVCTKGQC